LPLDHLGGVEPMIMTTRAMGCLLGCVLAVYGIAASAEETVYVTDRLLLGLHAESGGAGKLLRHLESGTRLEVLEQSGNYSHVRTPDGTVGWVKSAFLQGEKPARATLPELQTRHDTLVAELDSARDALSRAQGNLAELEEQASVATADATASQQALKGLRSENERLTATLAALGGRVPARWIWIASGACLVVGFLGGIWFLDARIRRRHGGFRIH
jgi:SH3 domain protein